MLAPSSTYVYFGYQSVNVTEPGQTFNLTFGSLFSRIDWSVHLFAVSYNLVPQSTITTIQATTLTSTTCTVDDDLGWMSSFMPSSAITAWNGVTTYSMNCGRLNTPVGNSPAPGCAACPTAVDTVLMDFGKPINVRAIAIQGCYASGLTTNANYLWPNFAVQTSLDNLEFFRLPSPSNLLAQRSFVGVTDSETVGKTVFDHPIIARYVRITSTVARPIRLEYYGCRFDADLNAPGWLPGFPIVSDTQAYQLTLSVALNTTGLVYLTVTRAASARPTRVQLVNAGPFAAPYSFGSFAVNVTQPYTVFNITIPNLYSRTSWALHTLALSYNNIAQAAITTTLHDTPTPPGCGEELGLESRYMQDSAITATNSYSSSAPRCARLNQVVNQYSCGSVNGWTSYPSYSDSNYLQVDLGSLARIDTIATQGITSWNEWFTSYDLQFSTDNRDYFPLPDVANGFSFPRITGNTNANTIVKRTFSNFVLARFVRYIPRTSSNSAYYGGVRLEFYGCRNVLPNPPQWADGYPRIAEIGVYNVTVSLRLSNTTSGSVYFAVTRASDARALSRLDLIRGWKAAEQVHSKSWLKAESDTEYNVTLTGLFSRIPYVVQLLAVSDNLIPQTTITKLYATTLIPQGCTRGDDLGVGSMYLGGSMMSANGTDRISAQCARLNMPANAIAGCTYGCWRGKRYEYLDVDLSAISRVTHIAVQGCPNHEYWVNQYSIETSLNGQDWFYVPEAISDLGAQVYAGATSRSGVVVEPSNFLGIPLWARYVRFKPVAGTSTMGARLEYYGCRETAVYEVLTDMQKPLYGDGYPRIVPGSVTSSTLTVSVILTQPSFVWLMLTRAGTYTPTRREMTEFQNLPNFVVVQKRIDAGTPGEAAVFEFGSTLSSKIFSRMDYDLFVFALTRDMVPSDNVVKLSVSTPAPILCSADLDNELGVSSRFISDVNMTASSQRNVGRNPSCGRQDLVANSFGCTDGCWSPSVSSGSWLQVDLPRLASVSGVSISGCDNAILSEFVKTTELDVSLDGVNWYRVPDEDPSMPFVMTTSSVARSIKTLPTPAYARHVRFRPTSWNVNVAMRVGILGCYDDAPDFTSASTGPSMVDGYPKADISLTSVVITARTNKVANVYATILREPSTAPSGANIMLQNVPDAIAFGAEQSAVSDVTFTFNQLYPRVSYSVYLFAVTPGLIPMSEVIRVPITMPLPPGCSSGLGFESAIIPNWAFTSTVALANAGAICARLGTTVATPSCSQGAWIGATYAPVSAVTVDLQQQTLLTGFKMQGISNNWVTKLRLEVSQDGVDFLPLHKQPYGLLTRDFYDSDLSQNTLAYIRGYGRGLTLQSYTYGSSGPVTFHSSRLVTNINIASSGSSLFSGLPSASFNTFSGFLRPAASGAYNFRLNFAAGVGTASLQIGDSLLFNGAASTSNSGAIYLEKGLYYPITVYLLDSTSVSYSFQLMWATPSQSSYEIVPPDVLFPQFTAPSMQEFGGNSDATSIVTRTLAVPVIARYVRFVPTATYNRPALRIEALGCNNSDVVTSPTFVDTPTISNVQPSSFSVDFTISSPAIVYASVVREAVLDPLAGDVMRGLPGSIRSAVVFANSTDLYTMNFDDLYPQIQYTVYIVAVSESMSASQVVELRSMLPANTSCSAPLGLESGYVTDNQLSATIGTSDPTCARLGWNSITSACGSLGWSHNSGAGSNLTIDLLFKHGISGVVVQSPTYQNAVLSRLRMFYSVDGLSFIRVPGWPPANNATLVGKTTNGVSTIMFVVPVYARYFRVQPNATDYIITNTGLRLELLGCENVTLAGVAPEFTTAPRVVSTSPNGLEIELAVDMTSIVTMIALPRNAEPPRAVFVDEVRDAAGQLLIDPSRMAVQKTIAANSLTTVSFLHLTAYTELSIYIVARSMGTNYLQLLPTRLDITTTSDLETCTSDLGLQSGRIRDSELTASSAQAGYFAHCARLNSLVQSTCTSPFWVAQTCASGQYWQILSDEHFLLTAIGSRAGKANNYISTFSLNFTSDGINWLPYQSFGSQQRFIFTANTDGIATARAELPQPVVLRGVRIIVEAFAVCPSAQFELYGCDHGPLVTEPSELAFSQQPTVTIGEQAVTFGVQTDRPASVYYKLQPAWMDAPTIPGLLRSLNAYGQVDTTLSGVVAVEGNALTPFTVNGLLHGISYNAYMVLMTAQQRFSAMTTLSFTLPHDELCISPTGSESFGLPDSVFSASGTLATSEPRCARLNMGTTNAALCAAGGWRSSTTNLANYFQIDFPTLYTLTKLDIQGHSSANEWIKTFELHTSRDGVNFVPQIAAEGGSVVSYTGSIDANSVAPNTFIVPLVAKAVRIVPLSIQTRASLRQEFFGCPAVNATLLDYTPGFPFVSSVEPFAVNVTVSLTSAGTVYLVIVRAGSPAPSVRQVALGLNATNYQLGDAMFRRLVLNGNETRVVAFPVYSRSSYDVYIYAHNANNVATPTPLTKLSATTPAPAGCDKELGFESGFIATSQLTASGGSGALSCARLNRYYGDNDGLCGNSRGCWYPSIANPMLTVDFLQPTQFSGIQTQGCDNLDAAAETFKLSISDDGVSWFPLVSTPYLPTVFPGNTDRATIRTTLFTPPLWARYVRWEPAGTTGGRLEFLGCSQESFPTAVAFLPGYPWVVPTQHRLTVTIALDGPAIVYIAVVRGDTPAPTREELVRGSFTNFYYLFGNNVINVTESGVQYAVAFDNLYSRITYDIYLLAVGPDMVAQYAPTLISATVPAPPCSTTGSGSAELGIGSRFTPSTAIVATAAAAGGPADCARLGTEVTYPGCSLGGWVASAASAQTITFDLQEPTVVETLTLQGANGYWITQFTLQSSLDGVNFYHVMQSGYTIQTFSGLFDANTAVQMYLPRLLTTRYLRFIPVTWSSRPALRAEMYGCPLGHPVVIPQWLPEYPRIQSISVHSLTVAINLNQNGVVYVGLYRAGLVTPTPTDLMLGNVGGNTSPHQYDRAVLNVNFDTEVLVTFDNIYSRIDWDIYLFAVDEHGVPMEGPTLLSATTLTPACDTELSSELGAESRFITNAQLVASVVVNANFPARCARVNTTKNSHPDCPGYACWAGTAGAYITVDLSSPTRIGGIITQGCDGVNYYTKEFQVEWSLDGTEYLPLHVHENGTVATFDANSDTSSLVTTTFEHGVYARFLRVMPTVYESYPSLRLEVLGCRFPEYPAWPRWQTDLPAMTSIGVHSAVATIALNTTGYVYAMLIRGGTFEPSRRELMDLKPAVASNSYYVFDTRYMTVDAGIEYELNFTNLYSRIGYELWLLALDYDYVVQPTATVVSFNTLAPACDSATVSAELGVESGWLAADALTGSQISASYLPSCGRLNNVWGYPGCAGGCWANSGASSWTVDLGQSSHVTAVAVQGCPNVDWRTQTFTMEWSVDSVEWLPFQNQSSPFISNIFVANEDRSTVVEVQLPHPVYARYLRINSVTFLTNTGLRAEVYGCPVDSIPEAPQFTEGYPMVVSVSEHSVTFAVRLNQTGHVYTGVFRAGTTTPTRRMLMEAQMGFHGYARHYLRVDQPFQEYRITLSGLFSRIEFDLFLVALGDKYTYHPEISALQFTTEHPVCTETLLVDLGITSRYIPDSAIVASTSGTIAGCARVSQPTGYPLLPSGVTCTNGGWVGTNAKNQYLQIDFGKPVMLSQLQTQRATGASYHTSLLRAELSMEGVDYFPMHRDSPYEPIVFTGNSAGDVDEIVTNYFITPNPYARYLRLYPTYWGNVAGNPYPGLRVEVIGCDQLQPTDMIGFETGYPVVTEIGVRHSIFTVMLNRTGTVFITSLRAPSVVPTRALIVNGTVPNTQALNYINVTEAFTEFTVNITGLWSRITYDHHFVVMADDMITAPDVYTATVTQLDPPGCAADTFHELGIESLFIVDGQLSASTSYAGRTAAMARKNNANAWSPNTAATGSTWLQVALPKTARILAVGTQGLDSGWATSYELQLSSDGNTWMIHQASLDEPFVSESLTGNHNDVSEVFNAVDEPLTTRYLRFVPKSWSTTAVGHQNMRVELYGCYDEYPVMPQFAMAFDGVYPRATATHESITVSVQLDMPGIVYAILYRSSWPTPTIEQIVSGTNTKSNRPPLTEQQRITINVTQAGATYSATFPNTYSRTTYEIYFTAQLPDQFVTAGDLEYLKIQTLEPPTCFGDLGIASEYTPNKAMSASSSTASFAPYCARLGIVADGCARGGWKPASSVAGQYLQIDFDRPTAITGFVTSGVSGQGYVRKFTVRYSYDAISFIPLLALDSSVIEFNANTDETNTVTNMLPEPRLVRIASHPVRFSSHFFPASSPVPFASIPLRSSPR